MFGVSWDMQVDIDRIYVFIAVGAESVTYVD